jgi:hypothetical protein
MQPQQHAAPAAKPQQQQHPAPAAKPHPSAKPVDEGYWTKP